MINFEHAQKAFEQYLDGYDRTNEKIQLKITHTYGVIHDSAEIAQRMKLSDEDTMLAKIIALLHDIGRFEQLKRFNSFQPETMDHAAYGVAILFDEGMIRRFLPDDNWDNIIRTAIAWHSAYRLEGVTEPRTLLHAHLIRDADKLDNCRVKLEDSIETILDISAEDLGKQPISDSIAAAFFRNESILSSDRITKMDYWISYMAYFYDLNFRESLDIVVENNFVTRILSRVPYSNPQTLEMIQRMEKHMNEYVQKQFLS